MNDLSVRSRIFGGKNRRGATGAIGHRRFLIGIAGAAKRGVCALTAAATLLYASSFSVCGAEARSEGENAAVAAANFDLDCRAAILMEAQSGKILYEKNADEALPPASITKIMTLLLVFEAIERGELDREAILIASEKAASMGGSQIFLAAGEAMSVRDLIKSVAISSANDAAVVLAEAVCGSEKAFVDRMNSRAAELGMSTAHFENTNGLDDTATSHVLSARDVAIVSRELIKYGEALEYASTWTDTVRDGKFTLSNTNRLIRFYRGATGLKTGSTSKALYCVSATAERDGVSLIAVIMGAPTRDARNDAACELLDRGFANCSVYRAPRSAVGGIAVTRGEKRNLSLCREEFCTALPRGAASRVTVREELPPSVNALVAVGQTVGRAVYELDGEEIGYSDIVALEAVKELSFGKLLANMAARFFLCG